MIDAITYTNNLPALRQWMTDNVDNYAELTSGGYGSTDSSVWANYMAQIPVRVIGNHSVCLARVNDLTMINDCPYLEVLASQTSGSQADQIAMWNNMSDELYAKVELVYDRTPQMTYNEDGTETGEYYTPQKAIGVIA